MAALHLQELRIPSHAVRNSNVRLECHFELDGETLYSVKWYKDGNEFYRYVPRDMPPAQVFPLPGVTVNVSIKPFYLTPRKHIFYVFMFYLVF